MWTLLTRLACLLCVFPSGVADAQNSRSVFPAVEWGKIDPQDAGWSVSKLEEARKYFETLPPASIVVVDRGRVVVEWGDPALRVKLSSIRKSLLSALYGIYVRRNGLISMKISNTSELTTIRH
jgi:hypothetical protein